MVRAFHVIVVVFAVALVAGGCTVAKTDVPPLSGPSEFALSLAIQANPDVIVQDGVSQSQIVVLARDASGQPVKNLPLRFDPPVENATPLGRLSASSAVTDADGRAMVVYVAPPQYGTTTADKIATIRVTPVGTDYAADFPRSVTIRLVPPSVPIFGPIAAFAYSPLSPVVNQQVTFDASASKSDVAIMEYLWSFGDGTELSGVIVQHAYLVAGTYTATLTVVDANTKTSAPFSQTITVRSQ